MLGRLFSTTDARGQTKEYEYDIANRLSAIWYGNEAVSTPNVSFAYDYMGRRTNMTDGLGATTWAFVPVGQPGAGRPAFQDGPFANDSLASAYDAMGRVTNRIACGGVSQFVYDGLGRVQVETNPLGVFTNRYDGVSDRPVLLTYPNGMETHWSWGPVTNDLQLASLSHRQPGGAGGFTNLHTSHYERLITGEITRITNSVRDGLGSADWRYVNDAASQLVQAATTVYEQGSGTTNWQFRWDYDAMGNPRSDQVQAPGHDGALRVYAHNAVNQRLTRQSGGWKRFRASTDEALQSAMVNGQPATLVSSNVFEAALTLAPGSNTVTLLARDYSGNIRTNRFSAPAATNQTTAYAYDDNGNLTSDGTASYAHDAEDRCVSKSGAFTLEYDGLGTPRRLTDASSNVWHLVWEGPRVVAKLAADTTNYATSGVQSPHESLFFERGAYAHYQTGSTNEWVAQFVTRDHLGGVQTWTDAAGTPIAVKPQ